MFSALIHLIGGAIALVFAVAMVKTAISEPIWWLTMMLTALMTIPVGVLLWAGVPSWMAVLPMAAVLVTQSWTLFGLAIVQWDNLQQLRRERSAASGLSASNMNTEPMVAAAGPPAVPAGWWDAPAAASGSPTEKQFSESEVALPEDDEPENSSTSASSDTSASAEESQAFEDLIRRNF